jgi:hypothetical protein
MKLNWRILLGVIVLVFGALLLLQQLNVIAIHGDIWTFIISAFFATAGVAFLLVLISNKKNWWAAIPGMTLIGLAFLIGSSILFPGLASADIAPAIFMAFIGAAFWIVYFLDIQNWWAIIPGGVLLSIAALIAVGSAGNGNLGVGLMFTGMALTFGLVALLPNGGKHLNWAFIPAGVLLVMGLAFLFSVGSWFRYLLPGGLIVVGIFLIVLTVLRRKKV